MNRMIPKLVLLLVLLMSAFGMNANPIDMRTAQEVAVKFMNANTKTPLRGSDDLQLVTTYNISRGDAAFYVFNTSNGFVIVSADDCATPILGYSDEGPFDVEDIPIQLQDYLQDFVSQIQYGIENHLEADEATAHQWEMVRSMGYLIDQRGTTAVAPLLTDTWNQNCYYNTMCPVDSNGPCGHVYAGCAATSFAQIMHYWEYPTNGMGSHTYTPDGYPEQTANFGATTYDWAHMPNSLSYSSTTTEINAVATLMWHCGVAINMSYGANGSGASPYYIPSALVNYFGYSNEVSIVYKEDYSDDEWLALMKTCLDLGCPIHYSGWDVHGYGGHGFVCDGYNANNLLHFNWGWGGSANGYFSINAMNPSYYVFTEDNMAIINIHPGCTSGTTYQMTATAAPSNYGTISGTGTYNCGDVCTLTATANEGYGFMYWTENDEQVSTEATYSFIAMEDRNLVAHFAPPFSITTSVSPIEGGTVTGGGIYYYNQPVTLTATANEGYIFSNWTKNGSVVSYTSTYNLTVTESEEYVAHFELKPDGIVIGDGTYAGTYLPAYYYSSLTQQIYTASEMGGASTEISSVSFFNTYDYATTRNWNVYIVNTDKTSFENTSDWISVSESDLVFSGNITMTAHGWATVYFNTPFLYDGTSNVALIVDDNTNNYSYLNCRTFGTENNQSICIFGSYNSDYDPYNATDYTGVLVTKKNQVIFGIPSYDYTVTATVGSEGGGTVSGGGLCYYNQPVTFTAMANEGYIFSNWTKNGTIVSYTSTYNLTATETAEYVAHFELKPDGIVIGDGTYAGTYLPNYYYSSLTQQIYTASEMGGASTEIFSVSFFNTGNYNTTRNWNVYMVNTDKTSFESTSDWIPVSENDLVFSGNITMTARRWVTVYFSTPFLYDGTSNVALIVDDNTNSYSYVNCRTFGTENNQAIRIYGYNTNYDPTNPSGYTGALMTEKNQVIFRQPQTVAAVANPVEGGTVSGGGIYGYGMTCTLTATPNAGYYFLNWTEDGDVVSYDAAYSFTVNVDRNLVANFVEGESTCTIVFDLHDSGHNGWNENYLVVDYGNGSTEQLTLESGSSISYSREIATGSNIVLSWIAGSYTYQCSFDVKFENGVPIYHGASLNSSFNHELNINCAVATASRTITAVAEPEEGGTVEGAGTYDAGTVVTMTATPNAGYSFVHWKENGTVVSSNANYSFIVSSDRNLVAFFSLPLTISVATNMAAGGTATGAGTFNYGNYCTLRATPNEGYLFLNWSKNGEVVSCNATYNFAVTEEAEIDAIFMRLDGTLIGQGESTNSNLPSYSFYNYTLSQQIYTPEEIGEAGTITSISYYNGGTTQTRKYDIYMVHTDKTAFENTTDWITVTEADRVYGGNVNMTRGYWTTIELNKPFVYDGSSNLAIIVDDNTGTWSSGMSCRVYNANGYQAIHIYSDGTNYDPYNPSEYNGTRYTVKNQMILGIAPLTVQQTIELTSGWNWFSTYIELDDPVELLEMLEEGLGEDAIQIKSQTQATAWDEDEEEWSGSLQGTGLTNNKTYMVQLPENTTLTVTLVGPAATPEGCAITLNPGWNWIGFPSAVAMDVNEALAGFEAMAGDQLKSRNQTTAWDEDEEEWSGRLNTLVPGQGFMFYSASAEPKILVFRTGAKARKGDPTSTCDIVSENTN